MTQITHNSTLLTICDLHSVIASEDQTQNIQRERKKRTVTLSVVMYRGFELVIFLC